MEVIDVTSWEECLSKFEEIKEIRRKRRINGSVSSLLYRGQGDAGWLLETTLERYIKQEDKNISLEDYYYNIINIKAKLESYTQRNWDIQGYNESEITFYSFINKLPGYDYMIYLRHHNYPSPLLDWTRSLCIAAFFAFRSIKRDAERVSVYAYLERAGKGKMAISGNATIFGMGPNVKTHPRHYLQQCEYTIAAIKIGDIFYYCNHEKIFDRATEDQDLSWKINIPKQERLKVLAHLNSMNINAYSLFGSEESLVETLALQEFYLRKGNF